MKNPGKHQLRSVLRAFCDAPWSILPGPMEAMLELLNHRAAGERYTRDEIRQRIGYRERLLARLPATLVLRPGPTGKAPRPYLVTESGIALIPLDGILAPRMDAMMQISGGTSTLRFASYVREATADPEIKAIVLPIDSPGGQAVGLEEAAIALRQARDAKPTIAVVMGTMASAAYYIGAAAGEIVAGWDSGVGSIGTVLVHQEFSRAHKLAGTTTTILKAGRYKFVGNSYEPLTAEGQAVLQEEVDAYHAQFVRSLAASLRVSEETVRERFGQGKMFIASEALKRGMIHRLGSLADVLAGLEADIALADPQGRSAKAGLPGGDRQPVTLTLTPTPTLTPSEPTFPAQETHPVDPTVRATLITLGLITAEADEPTAAKALSNLLADCGKKVSGGPAAVVAALASQSQSVETPPPKKTRVEEPGNYEPGPTAADRAFAAAAVKAERERVAEIRARGAVLMQTGVTQEEIDAAIANGTQVERFLRDATAQQVDANPTIRPVAGGASIDKFAVAAEYALCARVGVRIEGQAPPGTSELKYKPLAFIAEECIRTAGGRALGTPEDTIREALVAGGLNPVLIRASADTPATGAGSFPYLLSNLANRILDAGAPLRPYSYKFWCAPMQALRDFRPVTIIEVGGYSELPEVPDGDDFKEVKGAETAAWIQAGKYGDECLLTPVMLQNDDLSGFTEQLRDQQRAHEASVNRCCTNVLIGNPTMLDTYSFFGSEHANVVSSSGAAPSDAELDKHEALYGAMTGVGGEGSANYDLNRILVPPALWAGTKRLLKPLVAVLPVTTATGEMYRGEVGYAKEKNLTAASAVIWYTFEDPAFSRAFVYAHMVGYERMRITRYLNPKNQCLVFQVEGRFAAAARNPRGATRDVGA